MFYDVEKKKKRMEVISSSKLLRMTEARRIFGYEKKQQREKAESTTAG